MLMAHQFPRLIAKKKQKEIGPDLAQAGQPKAMPWLPVVVRSLIWILLLPLWWLDN
jgi:hypothetical protein